VSCKEEIEIITIRNEVTKEHQFLSDSIYIKVSTEYTSAKSFAGFRFCGNDSSISYESDDHSMGLILENYKKSKLKAQNKKLYRRNLLLINKDAGLYVVVENIKKKTVNTLYLSPKKIGTL